MLTMPKAKRDAPPWGEYWHTEAAPSLETQIPVSHILALTDEKPIISQRKGKNDKTHWIIFVKGGAA